MKLHSEILVCTGSDCSSSSTPDSSCSNSDSDFSPDRGGPSSELRAIPSETPVNKTEDLLSVLGMASQETPKYGENVHEQLASKWTSFLQNGIEREEKKELMGKYPIINNCKPLSGPILNPEIRHCLSENVVRQDLYLSRIQDEMGAAFSALAIPVNLFFSKPTGETNETLKPLVDAAKLLANAHHSLSKHRRHVVLPYVNAKLRKTIEEFPIEENLFGTNLQESLKASKDLERASLEIKSNNKGVHRESKNFKRTYTHHKAKFRPRKPEWGKQRSNQKAKQKYRQNKANYHPYQ